MDKHYVCTGTCLMVTDAPKPCEMDTCTKKGQDLVDCRCTDGNHDEAHAKAGSGLAV